ncbi:MAG: thioredoxin family protein [Bacteroidota bacterium]
MSRILTLALYLCTASSVFFKSLGAVPDSLLFRNLSFEEAVIASKAEKKPIFLHAYVAWCHYCKEMTDSVYTDPEVGRYYNENFICIRIDLEKEGKELNKKLRAKTFPTHVFFDTANAVLMHRSAGKRSKPEFLELGREALDTTKQLRTYERRSFEKRASMQDIVTYFKMLDRAGLDNQITINGYLSGLSEADMLKYYNWRIIYDLFRDAEASSFQRLILLRGEYARKYTQDSIDNKIITAYNGALMSRVQKLDTSGYQSLITKLSRSNLEITDKIIAYAELNRCRMKSDWKNYQVQGITFIEKYGAGDHRRLGEVAHYFYERVNDQDALEKAVSWAEQAVAIEDNIRNNHTLANLYYKTGQQEKARKTCLHTIEIAKKKEIDYKQSTLLLEKIDEMGTGK